MSVLMRPTRFDLRHFQSKPLVLGPRVTRARPRVNASPPSVLLTYSTCQLIKANRSRRSRTGCLDRRHEYSEFGGSRKDTNFAVPLNFVSSAYTKKKKKKKKHTDAVSPNKSLV